MMNIYTKLQNCRVDLQNQSLKKTGQNKFAGYEYFELCDFIPAINSMFKEVGLCGIVSYAADIATLSIINTEKPEETIAITSPMSTASLKGCHEVQNLGAVETYLRRYLWTTALEITESDALDKTHGKGQEQAKNRVSPPEAGGNTMNEILNSTTGADGIVTTRSLNPKGQEQAKNRVSPSQAGGTTTPPPPDGVAATEPQKKAIHAISTSLGIDRPRLFAIIAEQTGRPTETTDSLTKREASKIIDTLNKMESAKKQREPEYIPRSDAAQDAAKEDYDSLPF